MEDVDKILIRELTQAVEKLRRRFSRDEPPPMEYARIPILVWDSERESWVEGRFRDATMVREIIEVTWTNVTQNTTDNKPDEDKVIDIRFARSISIQLDTTASGNTSSDIDVNVHTSMDTKKWDTEPYAEKNIGDNKVETFLITPGPAYMRMRLDENNSGVAYLTARVLIRE